MPDAFLEHVTCFHQLQNEGKTSEMNKLVSDDFYGVFSLTNDGSYETYDAEEYRAGNLQAEAFYENQNSYWEYTIVGTGVRSKQEVIVSAHIDFYLNDQLKKKAFCTEVFRMEEGRWKLLRQYMEKYDG
jgi:hypothetical protein